MGREVGGGSGWGTRVHPWWIHVDIWQNQYNIAPSASQLLAFSPGKEQAAGVWETCLAPGWPICFFMGKMQSLLDCEDDLDVCKSPGMVSYA